MSGPLARRLRLRASLTVLAACVVASCSSDRGTVTPPAFGQPDVSAPDATGVDADVEVESVAMVGDSITAGSQGPLEEGFRNLGLDAVIDAADGRRIEEDEGSSSGSGVGSVAALSASDPDLWVIALGSNDVLQFSSADDYLGEISALLSELPPDAPVVWVDTYLASDPERCDEFNTALRDALAFRGNATVADWAAVAPGDGVLADGIHPSEEGAEQFADLVVASVGAWLN